MANDITNFTVVGRLTRDAELKYTSSGLALSRFSVASNWSKKVGDRRNDQVSYFDFTLFGKRAESLNQYLTKGQQVVVSGKLRQDRWEDNGEKRSKVNLFVEDVQLVGGKPTNGGTGNSSRQASAQGEFTSYEADDGFVDDIPF